MYFSHWGVTCSVVDFVKWLVQRPKLMSWTYTANKPWVTDSNVSRCFQPVAGTLSWCNSRDSLLNSNTLNSGQYVGRRPRKSHSYSFHCIQEKEWSALSSRWHRLGVALLVSLQGFSKRWHVLFYRRPVPNVRTHPIKAIKNSKYNSKHDIEWCPRNTRS